MHFTTQDKQFVTLFNAGELKMVEVQSVDGMLEDLINHDRAFGSGLPTSAFFLENINWITPAPTPPATTCEAPIETARGEQLL